MHHTLTALKDVLRLALPQETRILWGEDQLGRPVTWAITLRPNPPAFPKLEGGELALVHMDDLRALDPLARLDRVVRELHLAQVAAIAVVGPVSDQAIHAAEQQGMPLLALPDTTSLVQVERRVIRLIVDREGYIAQRMAELQRTLTQIELHGGDLGEIAAALASFAQQPVLFLDESGQISAQAGLESFPEHRRKQLLAQLPNVMTLRSWAASIRQEEAERMVGLLELTTDAVPDRPGQLVVAPVLAGERVRGYCLLLRNHGHPGEATPGIFESQVARHGAAAAALEWTRKHAVGVAQERMRAAFLDELLASPIADEAAWIQRGESLGYAMAEPHAAWIVQASRVPDWPEPLLRFAEEQRVQVPLSQRREGTVVFWPTGHPKSARGLKPVASLLAEQLASLAPEAPIHIGIGRPALGPAQWLRSLEQARESWHMGAVGLAGPVTYFGDLGLYKLLTSLSQSAEAARHFRKTIQPLLEHDQRRGSELVDTLAAFFHCHGNLSQTAARLHIHRNTLAYRLEQIASITQLDLNDPDARFALQLALKLLPILKRDRR